MIKLVYLIGMESQMRGHHINAVRDGQVKHKHTQHSHSREIFSRHSYEKGITSIQKINTCKMFLNYTINCKTKETKN